MTLSAREKAVLRKLVDEADDDFDEADDDEGQAPRRRSGSRSSKPKSSAAEAGEGEVFVLRGGSAARFLSSLGISAEHGAEAAEGEAEELADDAAEGEPAPAAEPKPKSHSRYFRG